MSRRGGNDEPFLFDLPLVPDDEDAAEPPAARRPAGPPGVTGGGLGGARGAAAEGPPAADEDEMPLFASDPFAEPPGAAAMDDAAFPFAGQPDRPAPARAGAPRPLAAAADPSGWDVVAVAGGEERKEGDGGGPGGATSVPPVAAAAALPAGLAPRLVAAAVDGAVLAAVVALAVVGAVLLDLRPGVAALPGLVVLLLVFSFAYSVVPLAFWGATPGMATARLVARDRDGGPLTFGQTALRWLAGLLTLLLAGLPMLLALGLLGGRSPADRLSRSQTWRRRGPRTG